MLIDNVIHHFAQDTSRAHWSVISYVRQRAILVDSHVDCPFPTLLPVALAQKCLVNLKRQPCQGVHQRHPPLYLGRLLAEVEDQTLHECPQSNYIHCE